MKPAKSRWERNAMAVKVFVVLFSALCFLGVVFWVMFPLLNTIYIRPDGNGSMLDFRFRISWYVMFLFVFNIIPPVLALFILLNPKNTTRTDLYFVFTIGVIILNAVLFAACFFYWFVYANNDYSGKEPFNDYRWCCVYYALHPELCANSVACNPAVVPADLRVNAEFVAHWIFVGVYLIFSLGHWAVNRLLRLTGIVRQKQVTYDQAVGLAVFVLFVNFGLFLYWVAVPLLNTVYILGYPLIAIPPGPGDFKSTLYGYQWWMLWLLILNIIPIILFLIALLARKNAFTPWLHYWVTFIVLLTTLIAAVSLGMIWIFDCNYFYTGGSICNDYRWCCEFFASAPDICPNVAPCPTSPNLSANGEFIQHFIFAIVFLFFGGVHIWLNWRMKKYGVFYSSAEA